jgi:hypothetical protein
MNSDPDLNCTEGEPVRYWIDALDRLVEVNDAWNIFAVENGAAELTRDRVLGQPIWQYVSDQTTQELYRSLIAVARESKHIEFVYRCDTPALKRLMQMTIIPETSGVICFQSASASVTAPRSSSRCGIPERFGLEFRFELAVGANESRLEGDGLNSTQRSTSSGYSPRPLSRP